MIFPYDFAQEQRPLHVTEVCADFYNNLYKGIFLERRSTVQRITAVRRVTTNNRTDILPSTAYCLKETERQRRPTDSLRRDDFLTKASASDDRNSYQLGGPFLETFLSSLSLFHSRQFSPN